MDEESFCCSWCEEDSTAEPVSHGICQDCLNTAFAAAGLELPQAA